MFTGIVEEIGSVAHVERQGGGAELGVRCSTVVEGAKLGDSIAVNGVCLTVTRFLDEGGFAADLMGETLDRTALGAASTGDPVNLERAVRADARLGGHVVQGHVDAVGEVLAVTAHDEWTEMVFSLPPGLAPYLVEKGSIAVDGTSLTVMRVDEQSFAVGLIPHTLDHTVLGARRAGDGVNLEADILAKHVERFLSLGRTSPYSKE
jgi:riboflavin synthase